jgi:hypothetical protein
VAIFKMIRLRQAYGALIVPQALVRGRRRARWMSPLPGKISPPEALSRAEAIWAGQCCGISAVEPGADHSGHAGVRPARSLWGCLGHRTPPCGVTLVCYSSCLSFKGHKAALLTAQGNGEAGLIGVVQGVYRGDFGCISAEAHSLTIEGGYVTDGASRDRDETESRS